MEDESRDRGWEITDRIYPRMARLPAPPTAGRTAEEQAAVAILGRLVPAARAEARAQVRAGRGRGLVLGDQTAEVRVWYVPAAAYAAALPPLPAAAREALALLLPVYDPATEAVLVRLTRAGVQPLWVRPGVEPAEHSALRVG